MLLVTNCITIQAYWMNLHRWLSLILQNISLGKVDHSFLIYLTNLLHFLSEYSFCRPMCKFDFEKNTKKMPKATPTLTLIFYILAYILQKRKIMACIGCSYYFKDFHISKKIQLFPIVFPLH